MQNTNPTSTSKRALDTIKLIGSQIIEIREILNRQVDTIQMLEQEVKKLRSLGRDNEQNIKIGQWMMRRCWVVEIWKFAV